MVTVYVYYNNTLIPNKITVEGHTGIKEHGKGYEICISLSALSQGLYKALVNILGRKKLKYKRKSGYLCLECDIFSLKESEIDTYKKVSYGFLIAIKELSKEYKNYIKYIEEFSNGT